MFNYQLPLSPNVRLKNIICLCPVKFIVPITLEENNSHYNNLYVSILGSYQEVEIFFILIDFSRSQTVFIFLHSISIACFPCSLLF